MFSILMGGCAWGISVILSGILTAIRSPQIGIMEWLPVDLLFICMIFLFASVMIPVQLKFGGERGRVALLLAVGVAVIGGMGIIKLVEVLHLDIDTLLTSMSMLNMVQIGAAIAIFSITFLMISYQISCRIMKKKNFRGRCRMRVSSYREYKTRDFQKLLLLYQHAMEISFY